MIEAVVFDVDGLLLQSEGLWDGARRELADAAGIDWPDDATAAMMGMSSAEWSRYMHDSVGLPQPPAEINREVVERLQAAYRNGVPWIDGAREAVERVGARWPLALATSSNREIVDLVIEQSGLGPLIERSVSSEEVGAGKPAPDVYLEAVHLLGVEPGNAAAIEDSTNGLLSASVAGLRVIAIPNPEHPPASDGLAAADLILDSIHELTPAAIEPSQPNEI